MDDLDAHIWDSCHPVYKVHEISDYNPILFAVYDDLRRKGAMAITFHIIIREALYKGLDYDD